MKKQKVIGWLGVTIALATVFTAAAILITKEIKSMNHLLEFYFGFDD